MSFQEQPGTSSPSDQVVRRSTRSGRRIREPVRYEPDPDVVLEDDYSDDEEMSALDSDGDSIVEECSDTDDDEFVSVIGDSGDESDSEDESILDADDEDLDLSSHQQEGYEEEDVDEEDILDFDCLTDNASDGSMSSDEED